MQFLGCLFVLSAGSYLVDYFNVEGYLRWSLILIFMLLKAGLIVSVFMHMLWERLALIYAILVPPLLVLVFVAIGALEGAYPFPTRLLFFRSAERRGRQGCVSQCRARWSPSPSEKHNEQTH